MATPRAPTGSSRALLMLQLRMRYVLRPAQFGGAACSEVLVDEQPCYPETACRLPENDCEDNSDEADCGGEFTTVCPREVPAPPGSDLVSNGFDAMAEEPRGPVLSAHFMGEGPCLDSILFRVHQVLPVSTFRLREPTDLVLSGPFLRHLTALPLEYNYALYRDIFRRFGTHYYGSGTLGGIYEMIYQYDTETVHTSGSYTSASKKSYSLLRPIIDLVRGLPCAASKRRFLRRALATYLQEFDVCRCAPCPNNAMVVLAGTECKCLCKTGTQVTCDNDDDFTVGRLDHLPPGVVGCLRPERPLNSYILKSQRYYEVGEDEEFQCFTGFENIRSPFLRCRPNLAWSQPNGRCRRVVCAAPDTIPPELQLYPERREYGVGESVGLNCRARPFVPESRCGPGQTHQGFACVCVDRESCLSYQEDVCALNVNLNVTVPVSACTLQAARCHGDPLVFVKAGRCVEDAALLDWVKFRARMASYSVDAEPCGLDTCYDWETCEASPSGRTCLCRQARDCPRRDPEPTVCMKLVARNRTKDTSACFLTALKCAQLQVEFLHDGACGPAA
ncbi:hypothetical protein CRUP_013190 [Coryphaenoides rupestris]|nr:hypothetical protein CRUP_013190 [Coryphaenoides rupestris]